MPDQRDIVLVPVPFTDLSTTKRRPVLVLSNDQKNHSSDDVVVAAITSQTRRSTYAVPISARDMEAGSLAHDSMVCADKIYTLHKRIIVKQYGRLNAASFQRVIQRVHHLIS